jgi:hypothetical protein
MVMRKLVIEGVILKDEEGTAESIREAVMGGRFRFIKKDDMTVGFFTFRREEERVVVENLLVYGWYRGRYNLLSLRKNFRAEMQEIKNYSWTNRRKKKSVNIKERARI